jgi:hypothetical protein
VEDLTKASGQVTSSVNEYARVIRFNTQISAIHQVVDDVFNLRFPCGDTLATLQGSRVLVYLLTPGDSRTVIPFYLQQHAWWAATGDAPPPQDAVLTLLNVTRCAQSGEATIWKLTDSAMNRLPLTLQNILPMGATLPVPLHGAMVGVLVVTRPPRDTLLFTPTGDPGACFGTATDVMANAADAIAPLLSEVRSALPQPASPER